MSFKWKDSYTVGIGEIDSQHKRLFEIGAQIYDLALVKDDLDHYDEIIGILQELKDYTKYHFQYEEKLMDQHNLPDAPKHKTEHANFIKTLEKFKGEEIDRSQNKTILDILQFTVDWITQHILNTDQKFFARLKA
ncbi:bacteriohemerythrin [Candidatus Formimonas warabiya]|uniref:Bacteriohemerythrin n=1 Tax=Formimonas warabiya TaxID=1761012 RepID=A0A3G1KUC6_FORW1|nr:bacteriohemerythrin [Candidatus Formimonas warabiya]ATW26052.1 bacteriohemerythrin [Candidatus Formimonas warabiya]